MNLFSRAIIFCAIWATINCLAIKDNIEKNGSNDKETLLHNEINELVNQIKGVENVVNATVQESRNETQSRQKRQLAVPLGFRSYDYGDYYGGLTGDYNYDYYDWVCSETRCQLCNILGGECCDPDANPNCFLPDSCLNNPCLAGGSCVTTQTIDGRQDFLCICLPGLTGKYCQITNDYIVDGFLPRVPIGPGFPPNGPFPPPGGFVAGGLVGGRVPIAGASNGPYGYGQAQYKPAPAPAPAPAPSYQQYQPAPAPAPAPAYQQVQAPPQFPSAQMIG